jgi:ferritin-like protein
MTDYHEQWDALSERVRDFHRALSSLKEEIEAIDWYDQRHELCGDVELKRVIAHNRDEEIEHAAMTLEWLRRNMPGWDAALRTYLFTETSITEAEAKEDGTEAASASGAPERGARTQARSLPIGSLKGK